MNDGDCRVDAVLEQEIVNDNSAQRVFLAEIRLTIHRQFKLILMVNSIALCSRKWLEKLNIYYVMRHMSSTDQ